MSGQLVSPESALPFFRQRCSELQDETLLLRARGAELEQENAVLDRAKTDAEQRAAEAEKRAAGLEQELTETRRENQQLRAQPPRGKAPQPLACVDPDALA